MRRIAITPGTGLHPVISFRHYILVFCTKSKRSSPESSHCHSYEGGNCPPPKDRGPLPGEHDFRVTAEGKGAFTDAGQVEIVGFVSCGEVPGQTGNPGSKDAHGEGVRRRFHRE